MLRDAQKAAEQVAFAELDIDMRQAIDRKILERKANAQRAQQGILPTTRY